MNINIWARKCSGQNCYVHYGSYATACSKFVRVDCLNIGPVAAGPVPTALQHMLDYDVVQYTAFQP